MPQPKTATFPKSLQRLLGILLLAIAYYGLAELSRTLAATPQNVTPVWPPDGIAVGAMMLFGKWMSLGVFLGSFFANFWAFRDTSNLLSLVISIFPVIGIALGTSLGTWFGTYLLKKTTHNRYPFAHIPDVFRFLVLAGMAGPVINATVGVTCLALSQKVPWEAYLSVWLTWWISNVSGIFIVTPILLSGQYFFQQRKQLKEKSFWKIFTLLVGWEASLFTKQKTQLKEKYKTYKFLLIIEPFLLISLLGLISIISFEGGYNLEYVLIPLLLLSAFRFGQFQAAILTFTVASFAIVATVNGKGSFITGDLNQALTQLQSFIAVITLTVLVFTAINKERTQAETRLNMAFLELAKTNQSLESRVQKRTEELNHKNLELNHKNDALKDTLKTLKQTQLQMIQSEKMSALGQMVAGIAHEINNPTSFIVGNLRYLSEYIDDLLKLPSLYAKHFPKAPAQLEQELESLEFDFVKEDIPKLLKSMEIGTNRITRIVGSLRNFSRLDEANFKEVDIHEGLDSTLTILQHRFISKDSKKQAIAIVQEYGDLPLVACDAGSLNQVFMNLLTNAIDALEESDTTQPQICIETSLTTDQQVQIRITDNAMGVPKEIQSKLFDPFFTTKPIGKGTGLGLSMSYQIITERHSGKLWCESRIGQGSSFVIEIPYNQILD
ncbi:integral membrane sensor signal transduction histidine kinase [[Leptolyngbya] sp. PCC 7376]|uniref:MASE1 domain-containing protein n=1 Tax=[Leptolyngbya] sp. PCC 7376 TaxID=111781 RepID=UPI00029F4B66|nr:MASE1 domain-containing protein [[Leptolyngbya] sp. PCC 7376]AFY37067.1 integral membrane sensor signal transduction histidine kinase [[Leptolyngbya] sp. PCC 7376]